MREPPRLFIVAGPNGVGKTTFAFKNIRKLSGSIHFVNLDEIARGLSPFDVSAARVRAARIALDMQRDFLERGVSFSIETTLAGRTYLSLIHDARTRGFEVDLHYFIVPDVTICIQRVAERVRKGGHDVPEPEIRRRFGRSLANLPHYLAAVDRWSMWDNTTRPSRPLAAGEQGARRDVSGEAGRRRLTRLARMPAALATLIARMPVR